MHELYCCSFVKKTVKYECDSVNRTVRLLHHCSIFRFVSSCSHPGKLGTALGIELLIFQERSYLKRTVTQLENTKEHN